MSIEVWFLPAFLSLLLWGGAAFLPKMAVARLPPMEVVVYQAVGHVIFGISTLLWEHGRIEFEVKGAILAWAVGVLGALGQAFYVMALQKGDVTPVSVVTSLYPGVSVLLAFSLLDERVTLLQGASILIAIAGLVTLVMQGKEPAHVKYNWLPPALLALVLWGFWVFLPKIALQTLDPASIVVYGTIGYATVGIIIFGIKRFKIQKHRAGFLISVIASVIGSGGSLLYVFSLEHGPVSIISVMTALYPVVTLLLARVFLNEKLSRPQICGVLIALVAIMMMVA